jgi:hypothetical protein
MLRVLRRDNALRDRLTSEDDSGLLIEEIAKKAGVKINVNSLILGFSDEEVTDQELEDTAPQGHLE